MTYRIYPYIAGSKSVRKLRDSTDSMIIRLKNSRYRYREGQTVINWGNSRRPSWMSEDVPVLNKPEAVTFASNKLLTLQKLTEAGVPTITWTTDWEIASDWDTKTFVRHKLTGHSGDGIEVFNGDVALPTAPLYTMAVENTGEYRVHVFKGDVILYQKKSRRVDEAGNVITAEGAEADVRNLASNWVYRTGNLRRLERIEELAKSAVNALDLDFGAVDIIKDADGNVFVLEVNTAPGISNTETANAYITAFNTLN